MFKKFLLISIVLFVVVLVSGCGKEKIQQNQSIQENQNQVVKEEIPEEAQSKEFQLPDLNQENWETYTDEAWGFSIKFPKEFYFKVHPQGEKYPGEECATCGNGGQLLIISDQEEMGIQDYGLNENVHVEVLVDKDLNRVKRIKNESEKMGFIFSEKFLNDNKWSVANRDNNILVYRLVHGDYLYEINSRSIKQDNIEESYKIIESIISTFKFIK